MKLFSSIRLVRHDLSEEYLWPRHVTDIFHQLSRPLPKDLASDVFQAPLPPATRRILQEALQSPPWVALEDAQDVYNEGGRPVTDVVDSVLSSVRMVQAASSFGRRQQQARVSWKSLIAFLGMTVSDDVFIACGRLFQYLVSILTILQGRCTVFDGENEGKSSTETSF